MKNKTFAKISLVVLSLVLVTGALFAMTAGAKDSTKPEIFSQNIEYNDKFSIMYAIKADTVSGGSVTLNLYEEYPADGVDPIASYTKKDVTSTTVSGAAHDAYIVTTAGVSARALDTVYYVQAVDAAGNVSDVKTYSVVEYLYTRLADVDGKANTETQNNLYKSVINFGTCAQQQFLDESALEATTLISDYCYVTTEGCYIDGKTAAVVPQNKPITLTSDDGALAGCTVLTYGTYNASGEATETAVVGSSVTINGYRANIIAGASKAYKEGTETFDSLEVEYNLFSEASSANAYKITVSDTNAAMGITSSGSRKDGTFTIASDEVYGKDSNVLKFKYPAKYDVDLRIYPEQGSVAREEADELELSFDIKFNESVNKYAIKLLNAANKGVTIRIEVVDGKLCINNNLNSSVVNTEANAYEYNNIRIVIKDYWSTAYSKYVPELYFYINNDTETATGIFLFNNSGTNAFSLINDLVYFQARFEGHETETQPTVYFDNVWCGFNSTEAAD